MADLGNISFSVDVDTSRLNRVDREVRDVTNKVNKLAIAITAAFSAQKIIAYANAWVDVNNKLINSVRAHETLVTVTERVFDVAQRSMANLDATADLYSKLERSTRDAGLSGDQLARVTETISKAMAVSGATASESAGALRQLGQAFESGVLRGDEFVSVNENAPRIMAGLAKSLGVTRGELRKLATDGKITKDVMLKAFFDMENAVSKEFEKTVMTMAQAFTVANNNVMQFIGTTSSVTGGIQAFNGILITLSENLDMIANAGMLVATVMGARFSGAVTKAIQAQMAQMAASRAQAQVNLQSAQSAVVQTEAQLASAIATQRLAVADAQAAQRALELARADMLAAQGTLAHALATDALNAARSNQIATSAALLTAENALKAATDAHTAAMQRQAAAANAASRSLTAMRGALTFLGGPTGLLFLVGGALMYFSQQSEQAKQRAIEFSGEIDNLISSMRELNNIQLAGAIADAKEELANLEEQAENSQKRIEALTREKYSLKEFSIFGGTVGESREMFGIGDSMAEIVNKIAQEERNLHDIRQGIAKATQFLTKANDELLGKTKEVTDATTNEITQLSLAEQAISMVRRALGLATAAKQEYNATSLNTSTDISDAQKLIQNLKDETAQLQAKAGIQRELVKASQDAAKAGATESELAQILSLTAANETLKTAEEERNKATKQGVKEGAKEIKRQEQIMQDLRDEITQLTADFQGMGESSKYLTDLGADATAAQIAEINDLVQQKQALQIVSEQDTQQKIEQIRQVGLNGIQRLLDNEIISAGQASDARLQIERDFISKKMQIASNKAVTPMQELQGTINPIQQLANEHAQKLAMIQAYNMSVVESERIKQEQIDGIVRQYETARTEAMWEQYKQQNTVNQLAAATFESLGSTASNAITGILTQTMTVRDALMNIASTIMNSVISAFVQMGIEQVKNIVMGQTASSAAVAMGTAQAALLSSAYATPAMLANIATMGAAGTIGQAGVMSAVASSKALAVAGGRRTGGPVTGGSMYEVGEGNRPEILKANDGRQYMIPGNNGRVIGNKDLSQGVGAPVINVSVINNSSANVQTQTREEQGQYFIDFMVNDLTDNGPVTQAMTANLDVRRVIR